MVSTRYIIGDSSEQMAKLATDGVKVDLILTSPPFLALRSYLPEDHPLKHLEIGSEPDPATYIDMLLSWTASCSDVLADHGSIAVELGDTYSGSGGAGGDYNPGGLRDGQAKFRQGTPRWDGRSGVRGTTSDPVSYPVRGSEGWPLPKCKTMIPELYRIALAYGFNPLTGEPSPAGQWRVRNVVTWCRPNPPVGALGDKYRPATSDLVIFCRDKARWFDLDDVRTTNSRVDERPARKGPTGYDEPDTPQNPAGAPPLDYWVISTQAFRGSHYATWPEKLLDKPIRSMCPREICTECGTPRTRIIEPSSEYADRLGSDMFSETGRSQSERAAAGRSRRDGRGNPRYNAEYVTTGWTECGCDAPYRPGIVLDPFAGSGTTLAVAQGLGRSSIGIDLDERNAELARERVGMFMEVS